MAIKINSKETKNSSFLEIFALVILSFLIVALLAGYLYVGRLLNETKKEIKQKEMSLEVSPADRKIEKNVLLAQSRIEIFKNLIDSHYNISKIFGLIESDCLPNVQFSEFRFEKKGNLISLSGKTDNFVSLGQQVDAFRKDPLLYSVKISKMSPNKEKTAVDFSLLIAIKQKIFQQ